MIALEGQQFFARTGRNLYDCIREMNDIALEGQPFFARTGRNLYVD